MRHHILLSAFTLAASIASLPVMASKTEASSSAQITATSLDSVPSAAKKATSAAKESTSRESGWLDKVRATGAISSDFFWSMYDKEFGNVDYDQPIRNNSYADITVTAPYISAGARAQFSKWPLPGFDYDMIQNNKGESVPAFAGYGIPYFWATGNYKGCSLTVGDYYEQFGSGLILRAYQDRPIGIDGALRGARLKVNPAPGVRFTALAGKQRFYWKHNPAMIWGADAEWDLGETFSEKFNSNYGLTAGASYVGKHDKQTHVFMPQPPEIITTPEGVYAQFNEIIFPKAVAAFDGRLKGRAHGFTVLAEGAWKNNDPSVYNQYTYAPGHAELLVVSYAENNLSGFIQAKRSENMRFVSDHDYLSKMGNGSINFMPPFTMTQTYALATIYPYATQYSGEWAYQAEVGYNFKRKTALGGKYGMSVRLTGSYIAGLPNSTTGMLPESWRGTNGPSNPYWEMGQMYYGDINFELNKKLSSHYKMTCFYLFQRYNYKAIRQELTEDHKEFVNAHIFVYEGQWKMSKKTQMRFEGQYMLTAQDQKDWLAGLVEFSFAPHWMIAVQDLWNVGDTGMHYWKGTAAFTYNANRFMLSYGRTREGFDCSGGVCRPVPRTQGLTFTYSYNF